MGRQALGVRGGAAYPHCPGGLANVRKHAHAKRVWITLNTEQGQARLTVGDDGRGFDPAEVMRCQHACMGLQSMQERAAMAGGRLQIESQRGQGTQVIVWLPMAVQEAA